LRPVRHASLGLGTTKVVDAASHGLVGRPAAVIAPGLMVLAMIYTIARSLGPALIAGPAAPSGSRVSRERGQAPRSASSWQLGCMPRSGDVNAARMAAAGLTVSYLSSAIVIVLVFGMASDYALLAETTQRRPGIDRRSQRS
jgi:hypothetical protein